MASPYTYEQLKARQRAANRKLLPAPADVNAPEDEPAPMPVEAVPDTTAGDTTSVPEDVLSAPAVDDSTATEEPTSTPVARKHPAPATGADVSTGKRAVVLNALRNSPAGTALFAKHVARAYGLPRNFQATPSEILQAAYALQQKTIPDITPEEYGSAAHKLYGDKVDSALLEQARKDYPNAGTDAQLIDTMYQHKIAKEETAPLSWADKAMIVARRYPELHNEPGEPEKQLRIMYDKEHAAGKDTSSFDDWLHAQMAPTLGENVLKGGAGLVRGIVDQVKSVGSLGKEVLTPEQLQTDVAAAYAGDKKAQERLKQAGLGGVNVAALAASLLTGGATSWAEGALGAAKTAPWLAGAAEGVAGGAVQGAGSAAVEGKTPSEIAQAGATGAGIGAGIGAAAGALHGAGEARTAAANTAEMEAVSKQAQQAMADKAASDASVEAARVAEINKGSSLAPAKYEIALEKFAKEYDIPLEEARRAIESDDSAAWTPANATVGEIRTLRQLASDASDARTAEATPASTPEGATAPAAAETPTAESAPLGQDVADKLAVAVKEGRKAALAQAKLTSKERAVRMQAAKAANTAAGGGLAGSQAELGALKGPMPQAQWEAIKGLLSQQNIDALYNAVDQSDLSWYSKRTAKNGLNRLLGIDPTGPPRLSELQMMKRVFGDQFVNDLLPERTLMQKVGNLVKLTLATPRALMTVHGFSVFGRQGANLIGTPEWWNALVPTARMWGSEKFSQAVMDNIENRPTYDAMTRAGVKFNELHGPGEELAAESLLDLLPKESKIGKFYHMNKRSFVGGTNLLRADNFDRIYSNAQKAGVDVDEKFLKELGKLVNNATGRGAMPQSLERSASFLGQALFSPRLTASRFQNFNPFFYTTKGTYLGTEAVRQNISAVGAGLGILGALSLAGWKVGTDYRSADFGKARKGNTRLDIFAGHAQVARLIGQLVSGQSVSSTTGKVTDLRSGKLGQKTPMDVIAQFFENKEAPIPSYITLMLKAYGNQLGPDRKPINLGKEALDRLVPIPFSAVAKAASEWQNDPLTFGGLAAASQLGAGVESYGPGDLQAAPPLSFKSNGTQVQVPAKFRDQFISEIAAADQHATARALAITESDKGKSMSDVDAEKLTKQFVKSERAKVLYRWTQANANLLGPNTKKVILLRTPERAAQDSLIGGK